jgi:S-formylglutathione hydrolase FrmB
MHRDGQRVFGLSAFLLLGLLAIGGCRKADAPAATPIYITVPAGEVLQDRTFHSTALQRDLTYRMILPEHLVAGQRLPVIYLMHGNGSGFREWSESSNLIALMHPPYMLIMPEGHSTYFINSATKPEDRYEDFVTQDLIANAEKDLPSSPQRADRAIFGVSMGGFAAINLSFKHPDLYSFVGALSPAIDVPERGFSFRRLPRSLDFRSIFGPGGSSTRTSNDPYLLAKHSDPHQLPYIFLSVGKDEPLREPVDRFEAILRARGIDHKFQELPGAHNWQQWNAQLPEMLAAMKSNQRQVPQ